MSECPKSLYVWLVPSEQVLEQPGGWRIRKWDIEPFPEATHCTRSETKAPEQGSPGPAVVWSEPEQVRPGVWVRRGSSTGATEPAAEYVPANVTQGDAKVEPWRGELGSALARIICDHREGRTKACARALVDVVAIVEQLEAERDAALSARSQYTFTHAYCIACDEFVDRPCTLPGCDAPPKAAPSATKFGDKT